MAISAEFRAHVEDLLRGFGPVTVRAMFGGAGVYHEGLMFGLIADETLYFKVDDESVGAYEAEGEGPFIYEAPGRKPIAMSYWKVPERCLDDPEDLAGWARRSHDAALREKARKSKRKRR